MGFTYDLGHDDADKVLISQVRFEIGDTDVDDGVKPNGDNFSDEEVTYWVDAENNSLMRSVAAGLETLSRLWSFVPDTKLGPHGESASQVAEAYKLRASELRSKYGFADATRAGGFSISTLPSNPYDSTGDYTV